MPEQRYPGAIWKAGPTAKIGYSAFGTSGPKRGIVPHSAEGWAANIMPIINDLGRRASWHFTILLDGTVWQHYEVEAHCWHAGDVGDDGGVRANIDLVGIEHEGIAGTRITDAQVEALAKLYRWLQAEHGFGPYQVRTTVYEHNWVSDEPTACPSGRIRHADVQAKIAQLEEAEMGLLEEIAALKARHDFAAMIAELAEANARGQRLPRATIDQIMYVLALAKAQG